MTTQIGTIATSIISLLEDGNQIYQQTANAMDAVEAQSAIAENTMSGSDKKVWVMAFIQAAVEALSLPWASYITLISEFIDALKAAYNAVAPLFTKTV